MARRDAKLRLGAFLMATGHHVAAWRHPRAQADGGVNLRHYAEIARTAERAGFDMMFLADSAAVWDASPEALSRMARADHFEPLTLLSAIAAVTERIGLVATVTTTYNEPYHVARKFASLDLLSGGRSGWNLVTSANEAEAYNFGRDQHVLHADRYDRAREFAEVVTGLWDSWEDDAFLRDKESGRYFRPEKLHVLNHVGKHFRVRGPLNVARSPQGRPVLVQAGSSEAGKDLAAETAEVVFTAHQTLADAKAFYADLKGRMARYGRDPDHLKVMPGIFPVIGRTEDEAEAKYEEIQSLIHPEVGLSLLAGMLGHVDLSGYPVDGPLPELPESNAGKSRQALLVDLARREGLTIRQLYLRIAGARGHRRIRGTPTQIADQLQEWFEAGAADGFNIMPPASAGRARRLRAAGHPRAPAPRPVPHGVRGPHAARELGPALAPAPFCRPPCRAAGGRVILSKTRGEQRMNAIRNDLDLDVRPVAGRIGAEVLGVRLSGGLEPATVKAIREALLRHKVIFFRGQDQLTDTEQEAFGRLLGELVPHPTVPSSPAQGRARHRRRRGERANSWHTDVTFVDAYPKISILRGAVVPASGGDTVWANTVAAYEELPAPLRKLADQLWALHTNDYDYVGDRQIVQQEGLQALPGGLHPHGLRDRASGRARPSRDRRARAAPGPLPAAHPGLQQLDSARLFAVLQGHVTRIENTVRWRWQAGDVAIWDNRATQHRAVDDYGDQPRVVRRVTVAGEVPVSIDGRRSVTRRKGLRWRRRPEVPTTGGERSDDARRPARNPGRGKALPGQRANLTALEGVELTVEPGEFLTIVGASGCGKSTLLRLIAGLDRDYAGSIRLDDKPVAGPGLDRGLVFQEPRLFPWLTVAQNVASALLNAPLSTEEKRRTVAEHIELVGLSGFEGAYPHQLSGGMAQRAAIARGLVNRPGVLLLDEPFGALDALTKARLQGELQRIWAHERITAILVTHDVEEAVYLGCRVVVMAPRPGRIARIFDVPLERPRDRADERLVQLRKEVLEALEGASGELSEARRRRSPAPAGLPHSAPVAA